MSPPYITGFAAVYTADDRGSPVPANSAAIASTVCGRTLHHVQYVRYCVACCNFTVIVVPWTGELLVSKLMYSTSSLQHMY